MRKFLFLTLLIVPLLGGCWNAKEISELSIATGIGIDKDENGNYLISVQLINPGEVTIQKGSGRAEVTTYKVTAPSIYEALRKLTVELPRRIYLSHVQIIILGEPLAKKGIKESIDFLSRNHEFRSDFYLLIARDTNAGAILDVMTPMQKVPSISLYSQIELSQKLWAPIVGTNLDELAADLISEGKDPVITGIKAIGDLETGGSKLGLEKIKPSSFLRLDGMSVFKGDKLVGWLSQNESEGLNYINSNVKSTVDHIKCPQGKGKFVVEVTKVKTKLNSQIRNGKPKMLVEMKIEEDIGEVQCSMDLSKSETIGKLEKLSEKRMIKLLKDSVSKAQKLNADIFGFGEVIHREHPKDWKKLKNNWENTFPDVEVNYKVSVEIRRIGTISNSIYDQVKE